MKLSPSIGKRKKIYGKDILDKSSVKKVKMHNVKIEDIEGMDTKSDSNWASEKKSENKKIK